MPFPKEYSLVTEGLPRIQEALRQIPVVVSPPPRPPPPPHPPAFSDNLKI